MTHETLDVPHCVVSAARRPRSFDDGGCSVTMGVLLVGTGLLFAIEPAIALVSPATYQTINRARREQRKSILWPAGLVVFGWGSVCLLFSIPPRHPAQWLLIVLGLLCIGKGLATVFFSTRLASVSESIHASDRARRLRGVVGLLIAATLIAWGLLLFIQSSA